MHGYLFCQSISLTIIVFKIKALGLIYKIQISKHFNQQCKIPKMYESLSGQRTSKRQIATNNFVLDLCSVQVNSYHTVPGFESKQLSMKDLKQILSTHNKKYKNMQYDKYYDTWFDGIVSKVAHKVAYVDHHKIQLDESGGIDKRNQPFEIYSKTPRKFNHKAECQNIQSLANQFCTLSFGSYLESDFIQDKQQAQEQRSLSKLTKILRNVNCEFMQSSSTENQDQYRRGLRLIELFQSDNLQLKFIDKVDPITPVAAAKILIKHIQTQKIYQKLVTKAFQIEQFNHHKNRMKKIYYLFLAEKPLHRPLLSRYLYQVRQQQIFQIVAQYDRLFDQDVQHSFKQMEVLQNKLNKFAQARKKQTSSISDYHETDSHIFQKQKSNQASYLNCLTSAMVLQSQMVLPAEHSLQICVYVLMVKIFRWLNLKLESAEKYCQLQQIVHNKFISDRQILLSSPALHEQVQPHLLHLFLLSYQTSFKLALKQAKFSLKSIYQMILGLVVLFQESQVSKILEFNLQQKTSIFQYFQQILATKISNLENSDAIIDLCNEIAFLLKNEDRIDVLLKKSQIVEGVDFGYICSLMRKQEKQEFLKQVIMGSIQIYKNTASFLNTGLPVDKIVPYFQIEILLEGLRSILILDAGLTEKSKQKFFGMMSVYRGERLPEQHQLKMTILQMLFEWYMLSEAMLTQDYKSLGLSLKCNLEQHQISQQYQMGLSLRLSQSSRVGQSMRVHNYEYVAKIGKSWFIENIKNNQQYQVLYISYMYVIASAIVKIKQSKNKIIKRSKLELWVDIFMIKVQNNLKETRGSFYSKLNNLKQQSQNLFAMHFS